MAEPIGGDAPVSQIFAATELSVHPHRFVLVGLPPSVRAQLEADLASLNDQFYQYTVEPDVLTLLVQDQTWIGLAPRYRQARVEGPLRLFTFSVAMAWDVVGFLAAVTGLLAEHGIPLGAACGYYRDHLFIAEAYATRAESLLRAELEQSKKL